MEIPLVFLTVSKLWLKVGDAKQWFHAAYDGVCVKI